MGDTSGRIAAIRSNSISAIKFACLPAMILFAGCNAPPPPAAAAPTTVIEQERTRVVDVPGPAVVVAVPMNADEQRRRDEEQRQRDEEQRRRDQPPPH